MRLAGFLLLTVALTAVSFGQDTNFSSGPQYLITGSPMFLQSISTPSLSLSGASTATQEFNPIEQATSESPTPQPNLASVYWGMPPAPVSSSAETSAKSEPSSEIELSSAEPPQPVPPSILDTGVTAFVTARSLEELGYGVSPGEVSSYFKTHRRHGVRTYTNADIANLPRT